MNLPPQPQMQATSRGSIVMCGLLLDFEAGLASQLPRVLEQGGFEPVTRLLSALIPNTCKVAIKIK